MRFRWSRIISRLGAALATAAVVLSTGASAAAAADAPVGYTSLDVHGNTELRGDPGNRLHVVVWYPARAGTPTGPIEVGPPQTPFFSEGEGAPDAPLAVASSAYPLIVVSHGTGGTAMDLSWLCAALAARGYVVASVTHPGNNALEPPTVGGMSLWWMRADDLSRTLDGVLADPRFGPHIDPNRIGAAGFSLGGYTVLALAGALGDPGALEKYCAAKPDTPVCSGAATPDMPDVSARARALAASDPAFASALAANLTSHRDPRVKAVFSIAPALGPAIVPASLHGIDLPVAFVAGLGDRVLPVADNALSDARAIPNARLTLLSSAVGHYTFLSQCTATGRARFAPICEDSGPVRAAAHRATIEIARSFFAENL